MSALSGSIQILVKTEAQLLALGSPFVPLKGQWVKASDTELIAIGDGVTAYADLDKFTIAQIGVLISGLADHLADFNNPHQVNQADVGLSEVDNTSDLDKPISNATQTALDDKLEGNVSDNKLAKGSGGDLVDSNITDTTLYTGFGQNSPYARWQFKLLLGELYLIENRLGQIIVQKYTDANDAFAEMRKDGGGSLRYDYKLDVDGNATLGLNNKLAVSKVFLNTEGDSFFKGGNIQQPSVPTDPSHLVNKAYADGLVVGLLDDRGSHDASGNLFPAAGGSGTLGAILKGDLWFISVGGTLGGEVVTVGDSIRALVDTPGQTASNWSIIQVNIQYVPENVTNKSTDVEADKLSNIKYPGVKAVYDWATGLFERLTNKVTDFTVSNNTLYPSVLAVDNRIANIAIGSAGITIDGQGGVPSTGSKGYIVIPYAGTINMWWVVGNVSGSIQFDIKRSNVSIIGAGNKPLLSTAQRNNAAPASWTSVAVAAGDELEFVVDSAATLARANLILKITKS